MKRYLIQKTHYGAKWYDVIACFNTLAEAQEYTKLCLDKKNKSDYRIVETEIE